MLEVLPDFGDTELIVSTEAFFASHPLDSVSHSQSLFYIKLVGLSPSNNTALLDVSCIPITIPPSHLYSTISTTSHPGTQLSVQLEGTYA